MLARAAVSTWPARLRAERCRLVASEGRQRDGRGPRGAACTGAAGFATIERLVPPRLSMLGGRSTVGPVALNHVIGVRIPASQPDFARPTGELRLGKQVPTTEASGQTREVCLAEAREASEGGPPAGIRRPRCETKPCRSPSRSGRRDRRPNEGGPHTSFEPRPAATPRRSRSREGADSPPPFQPRGCRTCVLSSLPPRDCWGFREKHPTTSWPGLCVALRRERNRQALRLRPSE
jgi:hypothetical protein